MQDMESFRKVNLASSTAGPMTVVFFASSIRKYERDCNSISSFNPIPFQCPSPGIIWNVLEESLAELLLLLFLTRHYCSRPQMDSALLFPSAQTILVSIDDNRTLAWGSKKMISQYLFL